MRWYKVSERAYLDPTIGLPTMIRPESGANYVRRNRQTNSVPLRSVAFLCAWTLLVAFVAIITDLATEAPASLSASSIFLVPRSGTYSRIQAMWTVDASLSKDGKYMALVLTTLTDEDDILELYLNKQKDEYVCDREGGWYDGANTIRSWLIACCGTKAEQTAAEEAEDLALLISTFRDCASIGGAIQAIKQFEVHPVLIRRQCFDAVRMLTYGGAFVAWIAGILFSMRFARARRMGAGEAK